MAQPFVCILCELPEDRCQCDRFCNLCLSDHNVRLCFDGLLYCLECREACELSIQN